MRSLLLALVVLVPVASLAGEPAKDPKAAQKAAPATKEAKAAEPGTYTYNRTEKRDPFGGIPVVLPSPDDGKTTECSWGGCQFDTEQLKVKALVSGLAVPLAGVEAPNGTVYIVDKGTRLGKRGGRVVEVDSVKGIVVVEEPCPAGKSGKCRVRLELAPDEPKAKSRDENLLR